VSTPSHGVGFEVAYAIGLGKPVLCLAREGVPVSKMIAGCPELTTVRYADESAALGVLDGFLDAVSANEDQ
jgi:2'-deoxynucleoside 5'-phosphate N-hydrolase